MSRFGSYGLPVLGFAAGWGSWTLLDKTDTITPHTKQTMYMWQLKGLRGVSSLMPERAVEGMNLPSVSALDAMIEHLDVSLGNGEADREPERVPFDEVLMQCRVQEQIEWLEEHVEEDIPFFFIADLFNAFANVNEGAFASGASSADQGEEDASAYHSPVLVKGTYLKMLNGVIPFDVSVRVLAALAAKSKVNAATLVGLHGQATVLSNSEDLPDEPAVQTILRLHADYKSRMVEKGTPEGDSGVHADLVDIASLQLLQSLNSVSVRHRKWYKPFAKPTGAFPALASLDEGAKSDCCRVLVPSPQRLLPPAARFAEAAASVLQCPVTN